MKIGKKSMHAASAYLRRMCPNRTVTPAEVVKLARPVSSPLHRFFEWDARKAHARYLLDQARDLLQVLYVEVEGQRIREYVEPVLIGGERRYVGIEKARGAPDLWRQVLERALAEAKLWRDRYQTYKELGRIVLAINQTEEANAHGH